MENKKYPLPHVYAYVTFWLSVAVGVVTFFWLKGPWYITVQLAFVAFMGTNLLTSIIGANYWRMPGSEKLQGWKGLGSLFLWCLFGAAVGLVLGVVILSMRD